MRSSLLLLTAVRLLVPLLLLYAFFLLWRGHNAPGGGFVGALIAAAAFVLYSMTAGSDASRKLLRVNPSNLLTAGLATALHIGSVELALGTPLLFDVGVFLAVLGVVLTIVFDLAENRLAENG